MGIDFVILSLILSFGFIGALAGASRQLAHLVALAVGYALARPLAPLLAPVLAKEGGMPVHLGQIAATVLLFLVISTGLRYALRPLLQKLFGGNDPISRVNDRVLGFLLAAGKVALIAYVMTSALTFVEKNVTIAGKRLGLSPKSSQAFAIARAYNLFELTHFGPARDLAALAGAAQDPAQMQRLGKDPAFQSLRKDARFRRVLEDKRLLNAAERGDYSALMQHPAILDLLRDEQAVERIRQAIAQASP